MNLPFWEVFLSFIIPSNIPRGVINVLVFEILPYDLMLRVLLSGLLSKPEYAYNMDYTLGFGTGGLTNLA